MKETYLKELKKIDKQISKLYEKRNLIKDELLQYRISTKDYISKDDLKQMPNKRISIDIILDSEFKEVDIPSDEGVYILDGRLDCSSYSEGILYYSDKKECYIHCYRGIEEKLDIKYIFLKDEDED